MRGPARVTGENAASSPPSRGACLRGPTHGCGDLAARLCLFRGRPFAGARPNLWRFSGQTSSKSGRPPARARKRIRRQRIRILPILRRPFARARPRSWRRLSQILFIWGRPSAMSALACGETKARPRQFRVGRLRGPAQDAGGNIARFRQPRGGCQRDGQNSWLEDAGWRARRRCWLEGSPKRLATTWPDFVHLGGAVWQDQTTHAAI